RPRRRGCGSHRRLRDHRRPSGRARAGRGERAGREEAPRGGRAAERLPRLEAPADRAARARGRGRPAEPRRDRGALPLGRGRALRDPLEGRPRVARRGRRRLRERSRRPRGDSREEPVSGDVLLVVVVVVALGFDFTNGFHDTANAIATSVGTRAVTPRVAVLVAAVANLAGAFVTTAVAKNVAKGLIDAHLATQQTLIAALFGAITWNLL